MKKDIEWLKSAIQMNLDFYNDKDEEWQMAKVRAYGKALDLINQLDETEVLSQEWISENIEYAYFDMLDGSGRLSSATAIIKPKKLKNLLVPGNEVKSNKKIMELESKYKDEVAAYEDEIISLENELEKKKNKIRELEYELLLEKTKDSKNSFYWFTAKKTPLVVDVSYLSYEDTLYGFKGIPNYHFIEKHDLRFITNCSLDGLIEQYK